MEFELSKEQIAVLEDLRSGRDAFSGCKAPGQCGARLRVLASLRRMGLIDHDDRVLDRPEVDWPHAA